MDGTSLPFFENSRRLEHLSPRLRSEIDENGCCYVEFIVRRWTYRDPSDMPHVTILGRRIVDNDEKP